jgi:hypothetical protein
MEAPSGGARKLIELLNLVEAIDGRWNILSVRLSTPGRHPKTSGSDVAEGRF